MGLGIPPLTIKIMLESNPRPASYVIMHVFNKKNETHTITK